MKLGLILMASGLSLRFGKNKLLQEIEGAPLYLRALNTYATVSFARPAVVSQYREILDGAEAMGFLPVPNPWAAEGISASIRLGMAQMDGMDGVLFAVCDQPWLTADSVRAVCAAFEAAPERIAALSWNGARGNPVLFPRVLFSALSALTGDTGGGAVIRAHPHLLTLVDAASPRELMDVDAPGDLS